MRDLPFLKSDLLDLPGVRHGFFGRKGGVSRGIYDSLNIGLGSSDDPSAVAENRRRVAEAMGCDRLSTLYQIHSRDVVTLEAPLASDERPRADGVVTRTPGVLIGALSADCVPILFADPEAGVIGAAHAGWKGALLGVTDSTLDAMEALGARRVQIFAAIGPAIGQASYEVDPAYRTRFVEDDAANAALFRPGQGGRFLFDIQGYVASRLAKAGVMRISVLAQDTCARESDYFSYRRTTQSGGREYGRQVSAIALA